MIVVRLKGGLGNQLFQYALGRVLSLKNNTELVFNIEAYENQKPRPFKMAMPVRDYALDVFNIQGRIAQKSEIPLLYRMYGKSRLMLIIDAVRRRIFRHKSQELHLGNFNPKMLELGTTAYLDGFWQSEKYFAKYAEVIRNDLTLKDPLPVHIQTLLREIKGQVSVCMHIRRTDFLTDTYYERVEIEYYQRALTQITTQASIDAIYVFSDDIAWCKEHMAFPVKTVFVTEEYAGPKDAGNLILMSACTHFIIPNSSFSWWGAWLNSNPEKIVIAPKKWFTNLSVDVDDILPSTWIRI